jgi:tellurite resistance protein
MSQDQKRSFSATRIPLNTFAIGFGLAGLAEVWTTAGDSLTLSPVAGQTFWAVAAIAWLWLLGAHIARGVRSADSLRSQLRHPAQGPIASLIPITGMLLAGELVTVSPVAGLTLFIASLVVAALFGAWLLSTWLQGCLALESVHGGYLLPTVAAGLVGAGVAAKAGLPLLGWALFGIGVFFWAVMTVLLMMRLAFRASLPDPLVPTMAILVAPPGVAGVAWFALNGPHLSPGAAAIAGLGVMLALIQIALIPKYRRLRFSLGFWSFTFPTAAIVTFALLWARVSRFGGWQTVTVVLLGAVTIFIGLIAVRSIVGVFPKARRQAEEADLIRANDADARVLQTERDS